MPLTLPLIEAGHVQAAHLRLGSQNRYGDMHRTE